MNYSPPPLARKPRVRLHDGEMDTPCWLVSNRRLSTASHRYRSFTLRGGAQILAHRYSWATANRQEIPPGMVIHHRCFVGSCVNPEHLALVGLGRNSQLRDWERRIVPASLLERQAA